MATRMKVLGINASNIDRVYNYVHLHSGLNKKLTLDTDGNLYTEANPSKVFEALDELGFLAI